MPNPSERLFFHRAIQYRPKYGRDPKGGTKSVIDLSDPLIHTSAPTDNPPSVTDATAGAFACMIQVFGHEARDQAGGDVVEDRWSIWCLNRDVRQGDMFLLSMNIALNFFVRCEDYTTHPNTGTITTFMRVFCIGTAPPEGYGSTNNPVIAEIAERLALQARIRAAGPLGIRY